MFYFEFLLFIILKYCNVITYIILIHQWIDIALQMLYEFIIYSFLSSINQLSEICRIIDMKFEMHRAHLFKFTLNSWKF